MSSSSSSSRGGRGRIRGAPDSGVCGIEIDGRHQLVLVVGIGTHLDLAGAGGGIHCAAGGVYP